MEISVIHSSCRQLRLCSTFLCFQGASTFPISLPFSKLINFNRLQKNPRFTTTPITPPFRRCPSTSCSFGDNENSGVARKVIELDPSLAVKNKAMEISPELKGTSIFLVGVKSNMKTKIGTLLADALRYYYFDSDGLIEQAIGGEPVGEPFRERDDKGFRDSETEVLKQLSSMGRLVVCAGDGAVQSTTNLALLRYGILIWIDVPLDMIAKEVGECGDQFPFAAATTPPSSSEVLDQLTKLYEETSEGYITADATVSLQKVACQLGYDDMYAVTAEDMAVEALKELERLTRVKKMMEAASRPF